MSQSLKEIEGSQPLFDHTLDTTEVHEKREQSHPKEESCGLNHKMHWLFSGKESQQGAAIEVQPFSVKCLDAAFKKYVKQIRDECVAMPSAELPKLVSVDKSILVTDDIKYLSNNGSVKYHRNMSDDCFPKAFIPQQDKRTSSLASFVSLRQQPSRSAKLKGLNYTTSDLLDEDDFIEQKASPVKPKKQTKLLHPRSKLHLSASQEKADGILTPTNQESTFEKSMKESDSVTNVEITDDEDEVVVHEEQNKRQKLDQKEASSTTLSGVKRTIQKGIRLVTDAFVVANEKATSDTGNKKNPIELDELDEPPPALKRKSKTSENVEKDMLTCPMCYKEFSNESINDHAYLCQGPSSPIATRSQSSSSKPKEKECANSFDESAWENASSGFKKNSVTEENSPLKKIAPEVTRSTCTVSLQKSDVTKNKRRQATTKQDFTGEKQSSKRERPLPMKTNIKGYTTAISDIPVTNSKKKRRVFNHHEEDDGIFGGYLTSHQNKPRVKYSKENFVASSSSNFFNDSMDNGLYKCQKCDKKFSEEVYGTHTKQCLNDTDVTFSQ